MQDIVFLALTLAFFALTRVLVVAAERLADRSGEEGRS